jgi:hypothetical protein
MLKYLFLCFFIVSAFAQKLSLDERRQKILRIVDEELAEVSRLSRTQDMRNPDTILRLSELNLEKARLYREAENERYLAIAPEKRSQVNKASYFQQSSKLFESANKYAEYVVKKFPTYKSLNEVYYILAYNNKELGNHDVAQKYYRLATNKSGGDNKISYKSRLALAEYYYNDHKYKEAIPLYESALSHMEQEKWWTKDAFNLAWCYYRTRNYNKAIDLMLEIHEKSTGNKYIDMTSQVQRDIGVFYVDARRMDDAIRFYERLGLNYTEQFVKIANLIISQGRFAQAEALLEQAAKNEQDRGRKIEIYLAQLQLFDKYNKIKQHLDVCRELVKLHKESPLDEDSFKALSYQVNKKAAELQKATASEIYANVPKVKRQKSVQAIAYFDLSAQLDPGEKAEKLFYQAETAYAATTFGRALSFYVKAFDAAVAKKEKKLIVQCLDGMLAALAQPGLNAKTANQYYIPVYGRYLTVDTKSERANSIFVKLFNAQFDKHDIPAAEGTMEKFAQNFPSDYKTQEGMLAKVMEYYRKKKDYTKIKSYVNDINAGKYKVSTKYANALRSLMTKIQIEGVQQSLEKGDKAAALKGYHQIYSSSESTPKARVNAAYNLSALYFEAGDTTKSYQWGVVAAKDMEAEDVNKFADSFLSISAGLFLKQHFAQSADLSYRVLAKLCKQSSANKIVAYKNSVFISLANGDIDKALEIRNFGKSCGIAENVITDISLEVLKDLAKEHRWEAYEKLLAELDHNPANHKELIRPMEELRLQFVSVGNHQEAQELSNKQQRYFAEARKKKLEIPVDALDLMAERMLVSVHEKQHRLNEIQLRFPEAEFNAGVKAKLQILDKLTTDVNQIQSLGSGKGIVEAYKIAIECYENFGESLKAFAPEGKSPEYLASFQKAMSEVYNPILANARKQRGEVKKLIVDNKILSPSNYAVLYGSLESFKRYIPAKEAVLMDREGRK